MHFPRGIYGEDTQSPCSVKIRPATALESVRLSSQAEFVFFVPFLPLVLLPSLPEPMSEFAYANNLHMVAVQWKLDYELVPKLTSSEFSTASVFGVERKVGLAFLNFARGMVLQDEATGTAVRLIVDKVRIIEPTITRAQPSEKLLASQLDIFVFGIQSPQVAFTLRADRILKQLKVVRQTKAGDPGLWKVMTSFWKRDSNQLIL